MPQLLESFNGQSHHRVRDPKPLGPQKFRKRQIGGREGQLMKRCTVLVSVSTRRKSPNILGMSQGQGQDIVKAEKASALIPLLISLRKLPPYPTLEFRLLPYGHLAFASIRQSPKGQPGLRDTFRARPKASLGQPSQCAVYANSEFIAPT